MADVVVEIKEFGLSTDGEKEINYINNQFSVEIINAYPGFKGRVILSV